MVLRARLAGSLAASVLALAGCGGDGRAGDGDAGTTGTGTDRAFAAAMVPHHESAIAMAELARDRGRSALVRELADAIAQTQEAEIRTLRREDRALADAGVEPGSLGIDQHDMGMDGDVASLRSAADFDRAFLEMMIPHHEGAIRMARSQLDRGRDPELRALARDIVNAQRREVARMRGALGQDADPHASGSH